MYHRVTGVYLVALALLLAGCDGAGSDTSSDSEFEATVGAPVRATLDGTAALGNEHSFENGRLFTFTTPQLEKTITTIQLADTDDGGAPHSLSFTYIADERITEGTYELRSPFEGFDQSPDSLRPTGSNTRLLFGLDTLFTASYGRQTRDSLFTYTLDGTVTVDEAVEDVVEGQFDLAAVQEIGVHRDSLRSFMDALRDRTEPRLLTPPPLTIQKLDPPMPVDGRFTAVPTDFENRVAHFDWMLPGGQTGL